MILNEENLKLITGGASISATFVNSIVKLFTFIVEVGRITGSSINRTKNKNYCP